MPDATLGINASCDSCGADNQRTGKETPLTVSHALGSGPESRVKDVELKCSRCGRLTVIREPLD
jgi:hypothetical protein